MSKKSKNEQRPATYLSEEELFNALVNSAFEFLELAINEFRSSTKFSTIHFAVAIEIFLKAKLMSEHWSLLLDKPDQADKAGFFRGDSKTVSPEQAIDRLHRIADVPINPETRDIFAKIAKHRNKMVHFVHADVSSVMTPEQGKVAEEQCAGWLAVRTLLAQWPEFEPFKQRIAAISYKMEGHRIYLQKMFESKQNDLKAHIAVGLKVNECPSCHFTSVKVSLPKGAISDTACVVCRFRGSEVNIHCVNDACKVPICFSSYDGAPSECPVCQETLSKDEIGEQLDTGEAVHSGNYMDQIDINCPQCIGYHTVVEHYNIYVCTGCYETDERFEVCEYCGEGQLGGVSEFSFLQGCEFCDGRAGNDADD